MKHKVAATTAAFLLLVFGAFGAFTSRDAFGMPTDVGGIPDHNPSHHPEDGDGVCEKGETVIKTTPSGRQVNVPCHAAGD